MTNADNKTSANAIGFLVWLRAAHGLRVERTYAELAREYGQFCTSATGKFIQSLKAAGYITIEKRGKRSQIFIISEEKYNRLVCAPGYEKI